MIESIRRLACASAVFGFLLAGASARAQESSELEALLEKKVLTSASKSAETTDSAPATATTITAEDLARHGLRTVADAVRFLVPGAIVEEIPRGSFGSRGVLLPLDFGAHVLVLIDGHTVNDEIDGSADLVNELGMPIELIDHVEVVLGPGSVLYGSNAMFGVINVVTKQARNYHGVHLGADAEFSRQYRGSVGAGAEFQLFGEHGEITIGLQHIEMSDPLKIGKQYVGNDVYTGMPLQTRADGASNGVWGGSWKHNFERNTSAYSRVVLGSLQVLVAAGKQRSNDPTNLFDFDESDLGYDDSSLFLDVSYQRRLSERTELKLRLYGDERRKNIRWRSSAAQYCLPGQLSGCQIDIEGGAEWSGLEAQGRFDWLADGRESTLLGVDGRVRNMQYVSNIIDAASARNPGSVAYYSHVDTALGAYIQHVARLSRDVQLNAGTRFDSYPRFGSALSPRAALVFEPWDGSSIKAIYSSAFRAPSVSTLAFALPLLVVPAESLGNERVNSAELTGEQRLGTHTLRTTLFYSRWQDMVELVRLTPSELSKAKTAGQVLAFVPEAYQYRNTSTIDSYGFTVGSEGGLFERRLRYGLSLTEAFARKQSTPGAGEQLEGAPVTQAAARLSYDLGERWPTLALASVFSTQTLVYGVDRATYATTPSVAPRVVALANMSGACPGLSALRYRFGVQLANHANSAYPVGTVKHATAENPDPVLFPLRTFTAQLGFEYTFE